MNRAALYTMLVGLLLGLAFSGTSLSERTLSVVFQSLGGLLAVGGGGILLRDVFTQPAAGE